MTSLDEITQQTPTPMGAALTVGLDTLSLNQQITFTLYRKVQSPFDGTVFWVRVGLIGTPTVNVAAGFYGSLPTPSGPPTTLTVYGSLHYATTVQQTEEDTQGISRVVFTSTQLINDLSLTDPGLVYIGSFEEITFAFSQRSSYYQQSGLFHYIGDAVYPIMDSQIIDTLEDLNLALKVISNSLPIWIAIGADFPIYPSYLVPSNAVPPYATVHIPPESTEALQSAPWVDPKTSSRYQLMKERAKVTFYGVRSDAAEDYIYNVFQYMSANEDVIGLMNPLPALRDEKKTQSELQIIAIKKSVEFTVSYHQTRINDVAYQLILSAFVHYTIGGYVPNPRPPYRPSLRANIPRNTGQFPGVSIF